MRLPRPRSPAIISLPRIDRNPMVQPMRRPVDDHRQRGRQQHAAKQLPLAGAHRARNRDEARVDLADAADGVEHDRKECVARAERDLRFDADAEEQDEQRQKHDQRNREHAGEQRLEYHSRVARTADEISDRQAASAGDRDRDQQLEQGDCRDCRKACSTARSARNLSSTCGSFGRKIGLTRLAATDVVPERDQRDRRTRPGSRAPANRTCRLHRGFPHAVALARDCAPLAIARRRLADKAADGLFDLVAQTARRVRCADRQTRDEVMKLGSRGCAP